VRVYLMTTSGLFGVLALVHVWRMFEEPNLLTDPWFILITLLAAGLCVWGLSLLRRSPR